MSTLGKRGILRKAEAVLDAAEQQPALAKTLFVALGQTLQRQHKFKARDLQALVQAPRRGAVGTRWHEHQKLLDDYAALTEQAGWSREQALEELGRRRNREPKTIGNQLRAAQKVIDAMSG